MLLNTGFLPDGAALIRPTNRALFVGRIRRLRRHPALHVAAYPATAIRFISVIYPRSFLPTCSIA
ncbi:hypothetical protein C7B09_15620 [Escherichia albertii]|uniref:Mannitol-1-phosphate 5-dehydrogenase n=1 Tax=Escherichia albertii TaxID=208962 RepID=A0ABX5HF21_ESCAL|nr:hypothetical protein [Escherichia albertii]PSY40791.1 hypothetical protein C7B09_15620 [Escherichia albertii]HAH3027455.1 hypothetical protein [Escherichia albertii]HAH3042070.1 hypothetical protein [Escherichia albertii]HAH3051073.1 hypothetical protein [Escherichia albertii]